MAGERYKRAIGWARTQIERRMKSKVKSRSYYGMEEPILESIINNPHYNDLETMANVFVFFYGGVHNPVLFAESAIVFSKSSENRKFLAENPQLLTNYVLELFRLYPPAPFLQRTLKEKDTPALICVGKANRDKRFFECAQEFNPRRGEKKLKQILTFGHGKHRCLGQALAILLSEEILTSVLSHFNNISD